MSGYPTKRLRRLRYNPTLRDMLATVRLSRDELIAPLFIREGTGIKHEIPSMPGQFQHSLDKGLETVRRWGETGLRAVLLFGIPDRKDATGSEGWSDEGIVQRMSREIKNAIPEMLVITDTCLCEYTDHGHCGPLDERRDGTKDVDNDATLELLRKVAVSQVRGGADVVAPSGMMDGQVKAIREALDAEGFTDIPILAYSVKFASSLYSPFRDAAESAPSFGDRRTYQMDYRSPHQAVREAQTDIDEGADIIMVKPAGPYLDVITHLRDRFDVPIAAYQVSGEYASIKAAATAGYLDERSAVIETTSAIKRAGTDLIITYFAEQLTQWL